MLKAAFTRLRVYLANVTGVVTAVLLLSSRAKTQNVSDSESASVLSWIEYREGPSLAGPLQRTSLKRYTFFNFSVKTMTNAFTLPFYHSYRRLSADSNLQHIVRGKTGIYS